MKNLGTIRYYCKVAVLYSVTLVIVWFVISPHNPLSATRTVAITKISQHPAQPKSDIGTVIAGRPVRLIIPNSAIDIPVTEGYYDSANNSWTLSGYYAQFAMLSTLANTASGETFIYGHNNDYVFGSLRHDTPVVGSLAYIYTDNGYIFTYRFQSVTNIGPSSTAVLAYNGPPILLIQTCTGSLDEWRSEYRFIFSGVQKA